MFNAGYQAEADLYFENMRIFYRSDEHGSSYTRNLLNDVLTGTGF